MISSALLRQLNYYITFSSLCQVLLKSFFQLVSVFLPEWTSLTSSLLTDSLQSKSNIFFTLSRGSPRSTVMLLYTFFLTLSRKKIIKSIGCPHTEEPPDSIMEYIHGEKGNAILIRRELVANLPVHDDFELHVYFERFFWHELGHFYAINAEVDDLHRYNEPGLIDDSPLYDAAVDGCGYSSERKKQEGYWFWQEFIAEVIANHVSYTIRSSGESYRPE